MEILNAYGDYLALGLSLGVTALMVSIPAICQVGWPHHIDWTH